jgi:hypothetical protein
VHIYAFGSICRGEICFGSDVDLLAVVSGSSPELKPEVFSIYSYKRLAELWKEGNPFAWHLALESRLLFSSDGSDAIKSMGQPARYQRCAEDCAKFLSLFKDSYGSIQSGTASTVFDLGTAFLSIRNFATCFSLGVLGRPEFSRHSALRLGERKIGISMDSYRVMERARILCTRGDGSVLTRSEISVAIGQLGGVEFWMENLMIEVRRHE